MELRTKSIYDLPLRVTYYARVSSESDEQLNSLGAPVNSIGGGRRQCADFVFHAVAFRLRNQSGFKQNLIVVAQPELFGKLFLCLLRRRFPLGADAVHLLFCCKYSQRELESCSSSSPPPTSTSCPFAFLHDRPRRDRGRFSFAGAFSGACCRCVAL